MAIASLGHLLGERGRRTAADTSDSRPATPEGVTAKAKATVVVVVAAAATAVAARIEDTAWVEEHLASICPPHAVIEHDAFFRAASFHNYDHFEQRQPASPVAVRLSMAKGIYIIYLSPWLTQLRAESYDVGTLHWPLKVDLHAAPEEPPTKAPPLAMPEACVFFVSAVPFQSEH